MGSWRKFVLVAAALALVASGLSWGGSARAVAVHAEPSAVTQAAADAGEHGGCHGEDAAAPLQKPDPVPMECCDGAGCACSCLQHAPFAFALAAALARVTQERPRVLEQSVDLPGTSEHPQLRPPIA